ncbi:sigma-70 family RNA polymerase sigma factor [Iningainema tapete]|uniref:Sigma-70 family RNA polymerase sigma factor n=1 Tax=Iningainema tapete BLCC-T55 TaxID=2748662 RepID=A0A8J6XL56_9CYAN|nr:sigma-70 family RNA polymerase sigma factor [Iningainema tapete]MBD2778925.1 sigma-70 family RNA polymerase sigma factor [Iningainema tapete BLCC-T55]
MNQTSIAEIDVLLQQLASTAQQYPPLAEQRQLALTKLVNTIVQSGRLYYPQRGQFSADVYEDIYNEALQELLLYICQNIDNYNPERGSVMTWVNVLLDRRFFKEAVRKFFGQKNVTNITDAQLDNLAPPEKPQDITEILIECIKSDPEDIFKKEHIREYPQANFQALALERILGKSWKEIAAEYNLNIYTVRSFYYRCLNKFTDKIKTYCLDYAL